MRGAQSGHHLPDLIELFRRGQMRQIARVDDEVGRVAQVVDGVDGMGERPGDVGVGGPGEADVAVADLGEAQRGLRSRRGGAARDVRQHFPADHRQPHGGAEPRRVPEQLATVHLLRVALCVSHLTTTVPCMKG